MKSAFRQRVQSMTDEGLATIVPGESWYVKTENGVWQYFDERHFKSVWRLIGKPIPIEGDDWEPDTDYDETEEHRIAEREQLEEDEYNEKICDYVIRSQECMEKHGCWKPPSTKFRNKNPKPRP